MGLERSEEKNDACFYFSRNNMSLGKNEISHSPNQRFDENISYESLISSNLAWFYLFVSRKRETLEITETINFPLNILKNCLFSFSYFFIYFKSIILVFLLSQFSSTSFHFYPCDQPKDYSGHLFISLTTESLVYGFSNSCATDLLELLPVAPIYVPPGT